MALKFILAGLISAILAGAAIFLLLDDATVDRIRAERERLTVSEARMTPEARDADMLDRLLGRDVPREAEATGIVADDAPLEGSRVGRRVADPAPAQTSGQGWLNQFRSSRAQARKGSDAVYVTLLEEAQKLRIEDVRDDAYLRILDYALAEGRYDVAAGIIDQISVPPLRDTGRQRIAVSLARAGRTDAAFAVLDSLEIEELADPIRLEIIRTATEPAPAE
ncbi:MAG: hypothetical protein WBG08_14310 [Litorimonas sp.]